MGLVFSLEPARSGYREICCFLVSAKHFLIFSFIFSFFPIFTLPSYRSAIATRSRVVCCVRTEVLCTARAIDSELGNDGEKAMLGNFEGLRGLGWGVCHGPVRAT